MQSGWRHGIPRILPFSRKRLYHDAPLLEDLSQRGFIQDLSRPDALQKIILKRQTVYVGIDPTAKSLHIGHLLPLMCLLHFQIHGHRVVPLIGGATGRIGDPSGRLLERQLGKTAQVEANVVSLTASIQRFFKRALLYADSHGALNKQNMPTEPLVVNNLDWHGSFNLLEFLQKVGVHARVNTMLNRESVRARLGSQQGLSFTEFTYQLLQAYDFYHLNKHFGCTIQIGGSDQWGNIVAGLELIGKLRAAEAADHFSEDCFAITTPLLTTSTGDKFGKSAGNAVWLDPDLTSVFDFYQYFLKVTDADVGKYLRMFTLMSQEDVADLLSIHGMAPDKRIAQHRLAAEVTEMVHSKAGVTNATIMTRLLFGSDYADLRAQEIVSSFDKDSRLVRTTLDDILGTPVAKLAAKHGLVSSNSISRKLVASRGLYLNNQPIQDAQYKPVEGDLLDGKIIILRVGKDKMLILAARD